MVVVKLVEVSLVLAERVSKNPKKIGASRKNEVLKGSGAKKFPKI